MALEPARAGTGFAWVDLGMMAAWTVAALFVARWLSLR